MGWTSGEPALALSLSLRDNTGPNCLTMVGEEGGIGWVLIKRINKFPLTNLDHSILVSRPLHLLFPSVSQTLTELILSVCVAAPFSESGFIPTPPTRGPPRRHFLALSSYPLLFPSLQLVILFYPMFRSHLPPSEITLLACNCLFPPLEYYNRLKGKDQSCSLFFLHHLGQYMTFSRHPKVVV